MAAKDFLPIVIVGAVAVFLFYFLSKGQGVSPKQTGPTLGLDPNIHPGGSASVSGANGLAISEIYSPTYIPVNINETQNTTTVTPKIGLFNF